MYIYTHTHVRIYIYIHIATITNPYPPVQDIMSADLLCAYRIGILSSRNCLYAQGEQ